MGSELNPKAEGPIAQQSEAEQQNNKSGIVGTLKSLTPPPVNGEAGNTKSNTQKWREWIEANPVLLVAIIAAAFSFGSCYGSNRSANTAERALKTTTENFQLDQRAWMVAKSPQGPGEVKERINLPLKANAVNSGKTPALNVRTITSAMITPKDNQFIPIYKGNTPASWSTGPVGPGMPIQPLVGEFVITKEQKEAFIQGTSIIYVYGEISYGDVFGHPFCTEHCFFFITTLDDPRVCYSHNKPTNTKCDNIK